MNEDVTIVDYGMGNLLSVRRAFEYCGARVEVTAVPGEIESAKRLVLPGVGAFRDGMIELAERGLVKAILRFTATGRPFLGICLGMQMMFEIGDEHGENRGLGLLPGRVVAIPKIGPDGSVRKIPQIGWNALRSASGRLDWTRTILNGAISGETSVYFVHSYHAQPTERLDCLAYCDYQACELTAAVSHANLHGCQFHPEKSGEAGLRVIRNFLAVEAA